MKLCWFYHKWMANEMPLPAFVNRHVQQCPDCQRRHQALDRIEEQLRSETAPVRVATAPFLHQRIMSAVRAADRSSKTAYAGHLRWANAALVATLVIMVYQIGRPLPSHEPQTLATMPGIQSLTTQIKSLHKPSWQELSVYMEKPLQDELQFMENDARRALQTLACNFVPQAYLPSTLMPQPQ